MDTSIVEFTSAGHRLVGTLVRPDRAAAVALLISGSGPIDRNSNSKRVRLEVMSAVAERLAEVGVASFRYDKRGVGDSEGDYRATGLHDNVADSRAALAAVRTGFERVLVVGHSEGALIAVELAADDPNLAGAVLLAGSAQTGEQVLRRQVLRVGESVPAAARWVLALLRRDLAEIQAKRMRRIAASTEDVIRIQGLRVNARWFREFMAHDPASALRRIEAPVLAITGDKDVQVDPDDLERVAELIRGTTTIQRPENLTHLLRTDAGPASVRTYRAQMKRPVDPDVLDSIADWMIDQATVENGSPRATL